MDFPPLSQRQKDYLSEQYGLDPSLIERVLADIWIFTALSPEAYALRRHEELKRGGERNQDIYPKLERELEEGRFQAPEYNERKVRRIIYG